MKNVITATVLGVALCAGAYAVVRPGRPEGKKTGDFVKDESTRAIVSPAGEIASAAPAPAELRERTAQEREAPAAASAKAPEHPPTAQEMRAEARTEVTTSPPTRATWSRRAPEMVQTMDRAMVTAGIKARFSKVECFERGCISTLTADDSNALVEARRVITESDAFQSWPGAKYKSPAITGASGVEADWIFYSPQGDGNAE